MLSTREIQLEEKKILDQVVKILNDNKLNYFLCGGTLLGSIRHEGFIPWDDDIDIAMPRPDHDKLQELLKEEKIVTSNDLLSHSITLNNLNLYFTKVYNHKIRIYDYRYKDFYEKYLWIDIFPIDFIPSDEKKCKKLFKKRKILQKILMIRKMSIKYIFQNKKRFLINIFKLFLKILLLILPEKFITQLIYNLIKKDTKNSSKYAGNIAWKIGMKERMNKEIFDEYEFLDFEGSKYRGLKKYNEFLINIYGDYMTLPPEDKRVTHSFEAWRVEENDEENKK